MGKLLEKLKELRRHPALAQLHWQEVRAVAGISIVIGLLGLTLPMYSMQVFDRVLTSRSTDTLLLLTLAICLIIGISSLLDVFRGQALIRIANRFEVGASSRALETTVRAIAAGAPGSAQSLRDVGAIRQFVGSSHGLLLLFELPFTLVYFVVVCLIQAWLGLAMLAGGIILFGMMLLTEHLTTDPVKDANQAQLKAMGRADDMVRNAEAIEAMGMRHALLSHWFREGGRGIALTSAASDQGSWLAASSRGLRLTINILMTGLGAWLALRGDITTGGMIASSTLTARGLAPIEQVIAGWRSLVSTLQALERQRKLLEFPDPAANAIELPEPRGDLSIEQVVYVHPGAEHPVLKGVSLQVPAGRMLALIGPSGSGKSTLAKLITGVRVPRSGVVRLDGADVSRWNRRHFGRHVGYLPQDVELFAGSIRDNIARFHEESSDAAVIAAAQAAAAHEMILRLPKGYETEVGTGGAALSGGQRQRIGLARALYGKPKLVVLDEPNAFLDAEGEEALFAALRALRADGATVVLITHRITIADVADLTAVMLEGQIRKFGPTAEVIATLRPPPQASLASVK